MVTANEKSLIDRIKNSYGRLIESCPDLYSLKKRAACLTAFKEFVIAKAKKVILKKPVVDASYLDKAFLTMVNCVQKVCFGDLRHKGTDKRAQNISAQDIKVQGHKGAET